MAPEERGCLQGSTDTLQPVKVTALELQKTKNNKQAVSTAGSLCKNCWMGWTGKSPRTTDARGVPQPPSAPHPPTDASPERVSHIFGDPLIILVSTASYSSFDLENLVRAFAFAELLLSADFPCFIHGAPKEATANSAAMLYVRSQAAFFLPPVLFLMGQLFTSSVILSLSIEHRETLL